jgi:hypothetical protein
MVQAHLKSSQKLREVDANKVLSLIKLISY